MLARSIWRGWLGLSWAELHVQSLAYGESMLRSTLAVCLVFKNNWGHPAQRSSLPDAALTLWVWGTEQNQEWVMAEDRSRNKQPGPWWNARVLCQAPCSSWQHSHVCKEEEIVTDMSSPLPVMLKWVCQVWYLIFPKSCLFWFGFWLCPREGLILLSGYSGTFYVSQAGPIVLASLSTMSPGKLCTPMPRLPYSSVKE